MQMKLGEFVDKYCEDIVLKAQTKSIFVGDDELPYDDIIEDVSGSKTKIVYSANKEIPIWDILGSNRDEFAKMYPSPDDLETYDRYCNSVILLEGEEALNELRNRVLAEINAVKSFSSTELSSRLDD